MKKILIALVGAALLAAPLSVSAQPRSGGSHGGAGARGAVTASPGFRGSVRGGGGYYRGGYRGGYRYGYPGYFGAAGLGFALGAAFASPWYYGYPYYDGYYGYGYYPPAPYPDGRYDDPFARDYGSAAAPPGAPAAACGQWVWNGSQYDWRPGACAAPAAPTP